MKKVLKIDINGFYIEDVVLQNYENIPDDCVSVMCPNGFYKPKWNGVEWVEGLTEEELDAMKNRQPQMTEEQKLKIRVEALENVLMQLI